jgi:poly(3-hydroxybutyrate) depolymerase
VRRVILAIALLGTTDVGRAAQILENSLTVQQRERSFEIYVPEKIAALPPLLVLLHGSGQDGLYMTKLWKDFADGHGMILLAPNALHTDSWRLKEDGPQFIAAAIDAARVEHPFDQRQVYLFGQSGGAVYALILAMLESDYFAAVSVHAGAWRRPDEFNAMGFADQKIPVQIIIGDQDEFFSLDAAHRTETALQEAGFPVDLLIVEGQHHWYTDRTAPGINEIAWSFLARHKRDSAPLYKIYKSDR